MDSGATSFINIILYMYFTLERFVSEMLARLQGFHLGSSVNKLSWTDWDLVSFLCCLLYSLSFSENFTEHSISCQAKAVFP